MPTILTPQPEWSDAIQVPADGDLADEGSLRAPLSQLANGARWLHDIIAIQGVQAIRSAANLDSLRTMTAPKHGQVAYVYGYGIYAFLEGATPAEDVPWIIAPGNGSAGRWYHPNANLLAGPRSFVTTTAANKIPTDLVANGLVALLTAKQEGALASMATTPIEIVGYRVVPPNVRVGDIFHVDWQGRLGCSAANMWLSFIPCVVENNVETLLDSLEIRRSTLRGTVTDSDFRVGTVWTAQTPVVEFKAKFKNSGGGEGYCDDATIRVLHFRP